MRLMQLAKKEPGLLASITAIAALGALIPNLDRMARHWQSHEVAYAAMEQADETAAQFDRYLIEQRAYTQALQQYTEQLQEQQMAPQQNQSFLIENDAQGNTWCCASQDREVCWNNNLWYRCSAQ